MRSSTLRGIPLVRLDQQRVRSTGFNLHPTSLRISIHSSQNRITCRIPQEDSNPELHQLVTKYQRHKCSGYYKQRKKVKGTYCRFSFPRAACESATLKTMEECVKGSQRQVYKLPRSPEVHAKSIYNTQPIPRNCYSHVNSHDTVMLHIVDTATSGNRMCQQ